MCPSRQAGIMDELRGPTGKRSITSPNKSSSIFCGDRKLPEAGRHPKNRGHVRRCRLSVRVACHQARRLDFTRSGGGGTNLWPVGQFRDWPGNIATKARLVGHLRPSRGFQSACARTRPRPWVLRHFEQWKRDREAAMTRCPINQLRLPLDHTEGTRPRTKPQNRRSPDNDLAVGR